MARKRGRPAKTGARYASGKLKPSSDPIAPALWQRIATEAKKHAIDARLGSQLGRLFLHQELTSTEIAAGLRFGEIYAAFERHKGKRRSAKSPSYGAGGDHSIAEELMDPEALNDLEALIVAATGKFTKLQDWLCQQNIPRHLLNALEELCVEDRVVNSLLLPDLREWLNRLAAYFGLTNAHAAKQQKTTSRPALRADGDAKPRPNIDRIYWLEVVRRLRPDLNEDQLLEAYDVQRALVARAAFRRSKERRTDNVIELKSRR